MDRYDEDMSDELGFDEAEGAADSYDDFDGADEADEMDEGDEMDEADGYDEMDSLDEYDEMDEADGYAITIVHPADSANASICGISACNLWRV